VIGENILPELFEYITSSYFESRLDEFCDKIEHEFEQEYKSIDISQLYEFTHEHKAIFDEYQALVG